MKFKSLQIWIALKKKPKVSVSTNLNILLYCTVLQQAGQNPSQRPVTVINIRHYYTVFYSGQNQFGSIISSITLASLTPEIIICQYSHRVKKNLVISVILVLFFVYY